MKILTDHGTNSGAYEEASLPPTYAAKRARSSISYKASATLPDPERLNDGSEPTTKNISSSRSNGDSSRITGRSDHMWLCTIRHEQKPAS